MIAWTLANLLNLGLKSIRKWHSAKYVIPIIFIYLSLEHKDCPSASNPIGGHSRYNQTIEMRVIRYHSELLREINESVDDDDDGNNELLH